MRVRTERDRGALQVEQGEGPKRTMGGRHNRVVSRRHREVASSTKSPRQRGKKPVPVSGCWLSDTGPDSGSPAAPLGNAEAKGMVEAQGIETRAVKQNQWVAIVEKVMDLERGQASEMRRNLIHRVTGDWQARGAMTQGMEVKNGGGDSGSRPGEVPPEPDSRTAIPV